MTRPEMSFNSTFVRKIIAVIYTLAVSFFFMAFEFFVLVSRFILLLHCSFSNREE